MLKTLEAEDKVTKFGFSFLDITMMIILSSSIAMICMLVLGLFYPLAILVACTLFTIALAIFRGVRVNLRIDRRKVLFIVFLVLLALALRWNPFLYIWGGQDQGVYVNMSAQFERTHSVTIFDNVRANLPEEDKVSFDKLNQRGLNGPIADRFEGNHLPGVYIGDIEQNKYVFQFYPLHPAWMSLFAELFGSDNRVFSVVFFSLLSILVLALITYELTGSIFPAFVVAILLILNPLHVFTSRFPVTENLTVFFSAAMIYYLIKWWKSRKQQERLLYLVVSAMAWFALCLNHLASFVYLPAIFIIFIILLLTSKSSKEKLTVGTYFSVLVIAWVASLAYGVKWSFPYVYDIYNATLGEKLGSLFVLNWKAFCVPAALVAPLLTMISLRIRNKGESSNAGARTTLAIKRTLYFIPIFLLIVMVVVATVRAFQLGWTDTYQDDYWANKFWHLSHMGLDGFSHASIVALVIYISPFVAALFVWGTIGYIRKPEPAEGMLLIFLVPFALLRLLMSDVTYYYYYARYLEGELVPYILVIAVALIWKVLPNGLKGFSGKTAVGLTVFAIVWEIALLVPQYLGSEMTMVKKSLNPITDVVKDSDLLYIDRPNQQTFSFKTTLQYYYGLNIRTIELPIDSRTIGDGYKYYKDQYILSISDSRVDGSYIAAVDVAANRYHRGAFDVVIFGQHVDIDRYYLYRIDRSKWVTEQTALTDGKILYFGANEPGESLLREGWSHPESEFRWSEGTKSVLELYFPKQVSENVVSFDVNALTAGAVQVLVNGNERVTWNLNGKGFETHDLPIQTSDTKLGVVEVTFVVPFAKIVSEVIPNSPDNRILGISLRSLRVK